MGADRIMIGYFVGAISTFILFWVYYIAKYCIDAYPETRDFKEIVDYMFDDTDDKLIKSFVFALVWPISVPLMVLFLVVLILVSIGSLLGIGVSKGFIWFMKREEKESKED